MKKKILILLLVATLVLSVAALAACGGQPGKLTVEFDTSHVVYEGDTLDSLKPYMTVTYKEWVDVEQLTDFRLSGTLQEGNCPITVHYRDITETITITVVKRPSGDDEYTVTFKADGETVATRTYTADNKTINAPTVPAKTGYNGEWEDYTLTTGNVTVNAVYTPKTYTVTLNYDGATGGNSQQTITVTYNQAVGTLPAPTKTGSEFSGWYYSNSEIKSDTVWTIDGDAITIVAQWNEAATQGLDYEWSEEYQEYFVDGIGEATDTDIVIPAMYNNFPVTYINENAFKNCATITSITLGKNVEGIGWNAFERCYSLESVTICNHATYIGRYAFNYCDSLTSITIGSGMETIDVYAFNDCTSLTSVYYTGDVAGWCGIDGLGSLMTSSRTLYINNEELSGDLVIPNTVTEIKEYAFRYRANITSLTIPAGVTTIGYAAFSGCSGLASITVDQANTTFHSQNNCLIQTADKTLVLGCKNSVIPEGNSVTTIGSYAFSNCSDLTSIVIPNNITEIGMDAFYACVGLTSIVIPDSVTRIDSSAFSKCENLASLTLGNGVAKIGTNAFRYCSSLTSVILPTSITEIGQLIFSDCPNLTALYYKGTAEDWATVTVGLGNDGMKNKLYYYSETTPPLNDEGTAYNGNYWRMVSDVPTIWVKE